MKKTLIALTTIIILISGWRLSSGNASSQNTPNTIQDAVLQQAWEQLNTLSEPVQLADGASISGHDLAQFILKNNIAIEWDENNVCEESSCSVRYHIPGETAYTHDGEPIYMRVALKALAEENMNTLVSSMAHEIYHYTEPFGQVDDSLYEEYQAFNLAARITHTPGMEDTCDNPMQPECLKQWLEKHNILYGYTQIQEYPPNLVDKVDHTGQSCKAQEVANVEEPPSAVVTPTQPTGDQVCTINALGLPECHFEMPVVENPIP